MKWATLAMGCVLLVVFIRLETVIQTRLPINQDGDFAYHFSAIRSYFMGFGPYGEGYTTLLTEAYPTYQGFAYFYPAQTLGALLPFGAFDEGTATELFFRLNAVCLVLGVFLSWLWVSRKTYVAGTLLTGIILIPLAAGGAAPAMSSLLNSNFSNILLVGFVLWAHGGTERKPLLQGIGLTLLMLKPSIALSLLLVSLFVPAYRPASLIAILLTSLLYLVGSSYADPFTALVDYVHALSDYGEYSGNAYGNLIGIFAFIRPEILQPNALLSIVASVLAAVIATRIGPPDAWKTGLAAISVTLLLSPMHLYDMVLLMPALFLSVTRGPLVPRALLFVGMLAIVLGHRLGVLGFDAGLQFQTIMLCVVTLAIALQRFD